jgi:16S rRNA (guanine1207-N2)-methyltransferase
MLGDKLTPEVAIVLGSPREAATLAFDLGVEATCYQMDLFQSDRLTAMLAEQGTEARVEVRPDLWDLPATFSTALYLVARGGERALKHDMIEQAYHVLKPQGTFAVLSPYEHDPVLPAVVKKVFGKPHAHPLGEGTLLWARRGDDRARRRHEVTFHGRLDETTSLKFVSRPGVFSYGHFDNGSRALIETMEIRPGDRVLDLGCGSGTNGIFAARRGAGEVVFVDSNVRALALTELNARTNDITNFCTVATSAVQGVPGKFDVVLANPPYYAGLSVAELFAERARNLLKPGGRFYVVSKQLLEPLLEPHFAEFDDVTHRGYKIYRATT